MFSKIVTRLYLRTGSRLVYWCEACSKRSVTKTKRDGKWRENDWAKKQGGLNGDWTETYIRFFASLRFTYWIPETDAC